MSFSTYLVLISPLTDTFVLAILWGAIYGLALHHTEYGKSVLKNQTWLAVIVGCLGLIGLSTNFIHLVQVATLFAIFALAGTPIVFFAITSKVDEQRVRAQKRIEELKLLAEEKAQKRNRISDNAKACFDSIIAMAESIGKHIAMSRDSIKSNDVSKLFLSISEIEALRLKIIIDAGQGKNRQRPK